jgi:hypothetical protein
VVPDDLSTSGNLLPVVGPNLHDTPRAPHPAPREDAL